MTFDEEVRFYDKKYTRSLLVKFLVVITIYAFGAVVTYGAVNADLQYKCHNRWQNICDARHVAVRVEYDFSLR